MDMIAELEKIYQVALSSADANPGSPEAATLVRMVNEFKATVAADIKYPFAAEFDVLRKGD